MGNNCIEQLDILNLKDKNINSNNIKNRFNNSLTQYNSLFDIINKTKTNLGKRF